MVAAGWCVVAGNTALEHQFQYMPGTRRRGVAELEEVGDEQQPVNADRGADLLLAFPDQRLLQGFAGVLAAAGQGIALGPATTLLA